ncbi:hypothetical protein [Endozoicomonas atrinae]|uniref:hypothetical protein n=1 Tax=Endozoicomonas atrinae TaxID=1333660 RepID=UPI000B0B4493|nr:hypothetical protein [Endozoicomonas atrinae]
MDKDRHFSDLQEILNQYDFLPDTEGIINTFNRIHGTQYTPDDYYEHLEIMDQE